MPPGKFPMGPGVSEPPTGQENPNPHPSKAAWRNQGGFPRTEAALAAQINLTKESGIEL